MSRPGWVIGDRQRSMAHRSDRVQLDDGRIGTIVAVESGHLGWPVVRIESATAEDIPVHPTRIKRILPSQ